VNATLLQRPVGFAPAEISALVNEDVVSQHAEEAAFLWTQRNRAVGEPHYTLQDVAVLDERVEAHLDGLKTAGDAGWDRCRANLVMKGPGETFAAAVLAFGAGDRERMTLTLREGCASPRTMRGLLSALGWLDYAAVLPWIQKLVEARSPAFRAIGIAACAVHRQDPGGALATAVHDSDLALRTRAARTAGELKRGDLLGVLLERLHDPDEGCRLWAAWAVTLLGHHAGLPLLMQSVEASSPFSERAMQVSLRAMELPRSRRWISGLVSRPELVRSTVIGTGILGDPVSIPWLIERMESPELARLAGEAFTMITGVDLSYCDLDQDAPPAAAPEGGGDIEEVSDLDYESSLPWPSPELVRQWWAKNRDAFTPGIRYLIGKPITA
jgi:uncharacterized protein (TIGR02270 family)